MQKNACSAVELAREYYNSSDADMFYFCIWGGEDLHVGVYEDGDSIAQASTRTVQTMAARVELTPESKVLDLGAGFGGSARYLAKTFGCHVTALNLAANQNERNRCMTAEQGLSDKITVVEGSFEDIPEPDASFDVVWSQDAILHSANRAKVMSEAARVLKPGGNLVFTDPMMADDCPLDVLQPILDRIHLADLGSVGFYRQATQALGLTEMGYHDLTPHMATHYEHIRVEMRERWTELQGCVSAAYLDKMYAGMGDWIDGVHNGHLVWGILHFTKA